MSSRDEIFTRIRRALPPPEKRTVLPDYQDEQVLSKPHLEGDDLWEIFARNFTAVNGRTMTSVSALATFLKEQDLTSGYCDPALMKKVGEPLQKKGFTVEGEFARERYEDFQFGITRATGAIAESGSLILDDDLTSDRLAALSPWVHVGILKRADLIRTIPEAIAQFGDCPNIIWATGPSKTADVEGILIEGVHGPGEEVALLLR
jgi:L-lactate dehydrogenase complex protein LldG